MEIFKCIDKSIFFKIKNEEKLYASKLYIILICLNSLMLVYSIHLIKYTCMISTDNVFHNCESMHINYKMTTDQVYLFKDISYRMTDLYLSSSTGLTSERQL